MRREKKLFLLAMILILNTEMFGEKIMYGSNSKDQIIEDKISLDKDKSIQLNAGKNETDITKVINKTEITVDGAKYGITLSSDSKKDEKGKNEFVNKGTLTVNNGTGIYYNNKTNSNQQVINEVEKTSEGIT
uniref:hypothetical protein n=1 Tax=Fusobacterium sp. TaxID=68766 RepID=UPI002611B24F